MAQDKVLINPRYRSNKSKIEQDEKEIEELMRKQRGETDKEPDTEQVEETPNTEETQEETKAPAKEEVNTGEERTFKKRYGDLRRHLAEKEKEWKEKLEQAEAASKQNPQTQAEIEEWVQKNPKVNQLIEMTAEKKARELFEKTQTRIEQFEERDKELSRKAAEQKIREVHTDFDKLINDDAFHDWVEDQPKWIQDALYENEDDAPSVIRLVDLYKAEKGINKKQTPNKEAAKEVTKAKTAKPADNSGEKIWKESEIRKIPDDKFDEVWPVIQEQMRNGKFIYDLSGGAR